MRIVIIGAGGIGSIVGSFLSRYLNYSKKDLTNNILIVDGKNYKYKNLERQLINSDAIGVNKATHFTELLSKEYKNINYDFYPHYIDENNIKQIIQEKDIVFFCVDNHRSRQIIDKHIQTMNDITLISGGNDLTDGNVQVYRKEGGDEKTVSIGKYHPEIREATDKSPAEMSCEELAMESDPQIFFMNGLVAIFMCAAFYNIVNGSFRFSDSEIYIDMIQMGAVPRSRY